MLKTAIVTGATGIQGDPLLRLLGEDKDYKHIYAVSRRPLAAYDRVTSIQLDLGDPKAIADKLKSEGVKDVTHVYHMAFSGDMTNTDSATADMLRHLVEALEAAGNKLQHVYFTSGGKYYGMHFGGMKSPADERDGRHLPPNIYFMQEDYLMGRVRHGASWTWSSLRPNPVIGWGLGGTMNLLNCIAGYGTICAELGIDMRFPGPEAVYDRVVDCVDVRLLMEAAKFTAETPAAHNHSFNVSNGDTFRWRQVWPLITAWFGLKAGDPLPMPLGQMMADKQPLWEEIVKKYGLAENAIFTDLFSWGFGEAVLGSINFDAFSNVNKLRQAGFNGQKIDSSTMFIEKLNELADKKLIPRYRAKAELTPSLLEQSI